MTLEQLPLIMMRALLLTLLIECAVAWLLGIRDKRGQVIVALANLLTNPLVVSLGAAASYFMGHGALFFVTVIMEIAVIIAEGEVYRRSVNTRINPYLVSLLCNAASYLTGEILNHYIF